MIRRDLIHRMDIVQLTFQKVAPGQKGISAIVPINLANIWMRQSP